MRLCLIDFLIFIRERIPDGYSIIIVGDIDQLGNWDPKKGLPCVPILEENVQFISASPIHIKRAQKFSFKLVILDEKDQIHAWEQIADRTYTIEYAHVKINITFNNPAIDWIFISKYQRSKPHFLARKFFFFFLHLFNYLTKLFKALK